ncbi:C-type lectin domain family 4 member M-like [Betta splendens]|uniref:C-type lectin domain family 4 member M-like n=1 Tax=Betta splendens TaxID=158456 RepID=A0A6P7LP29_BETSP|nr:C-type lectin domain family 4 member M-like [Betta splendens]
MERSQPHGLTASQPEQEMAFEQQASHKIGGDEQSHFKPGLSKRGGRAGVSARRLLIPCLLLFNAVLLTAAVVLGIYCAKAKDLQVPQAMTSPLFIELNYLRNQSEIINEKLEVQATLEKERAIHLQLKTQVKQQKTITDRLQKTIEGLQTEKTQRQTNKTSLEQSCGRCPLGWNLLKSTCYYFSKNDFASGKSWQDSRADCVSQGGDLLVISDLEEQQLISDNFPRVSSSSLWWLNGFWMGLTDVVTEGTWVWVNNVTETERGYWKQGQPSHTGPSKKNCAAFYYYQDARATWFNERCLGVQLNWICEMQSR